MSKAEGKALPKARAPKTVKGERATTSKRQRVTVRQVQVRRQVIQSVIHLACVEGILSVFESGETLDEEGKHGAALEAYTSQVQHAMNGTSIFADFDYREIQFNDEDLFVRIVPFTFETTSFTVLFLFLRKCCIGRTRRRRRCQPSACGARAWTLEKIAINLVVHAGTRWCGMVGLRNRVPRRVI